MNKFKNRKTGAIVEARFITSKNIEEIAFDLDLEYRVGGYASSDGMLRGFFNGVYYHWEPGCYIMPLGAGIAPGKIDMEVFGHLYEEHIPVEEPEPTAITVTGEIDKLLTDIQETLDLVYLRKSPPTVTEIPVIVERLQAIKRML